MIPSSNAYDKQLQDIKVATRARIKLLTNLMSTLDSITPKDSPALALTKLAKIDLRKLVKNSPDIHRSLMTLSSQVYKDKTKPVPVK